MNVTVECAAVARATCRQLSRLVAGRPQLTTMRCCLAESSNDRQPAWASWLTAIGGARPVSISTRVPAALDPLVAGMRRVGERRAARVVIGQDGGEQVGRRRAHAVEQRESAVAVPEEAQHRHHAVDGVEQRRRRRDVARGERLPQRQQVDQQLDQRAGIAADVSAVGQDLPLAARRRAAWWRRGCARCWPAMQSAA